MAASRLFASIHVASSSASGRENIIDLQRLLGLVELAIAVEIVLLRHGR